jgi:hypothetical protein
MPETKWCPKCEAEFPISEFYLNSARYDGLSGYCAACHNAACHDTATKARIKLLDSFGGACVRCGLEDWRALHVDHVNGDGHLDRAEGRSFAKLRREVEADPTRFQVLCASCHEIKTHEEKERTGNHVKRRTPTKGRKRKQPSTPEITSQRMKAAWTPERRASHAEAMRRWHTGKKLVDGHWV